MQEPTKAVVKALTAGSDIPRQAKGRVVDKDALDILWLLQTTATDVFATTIQLIPRDSPA